MISPYDPPVKFWGLSLLFLPIGVIAAKSLMDQIDVLYEVADDPCTPRDRSESLLRLVKRLNSGDL